MSLAILSLSLWGSGCSRQGPVSPELANVTSEKTGPGPDNTTPNPPEPPVAPVEIPAELSKIARRLSIQADLPLVSGRIDIRDLQASGPAIEKAAGQTYRFNCNGVGEQAGDVRLNSSVGIFFQRTRGEGDSLRRDFEYVLIRCP